MKQQLFPTFVPLGKAFFFFAYKPKRELIVHPFLRFCFSEHKYILLEIGYPVTHHSSHTFSMSQNIGIFVVFAQTTTTRKTLNLMSAVHPEDTVGYVVKNILTHTIQQSSTIICEKSTWKKLR